MNGSKGLDGSKAWAEKFFLVWSFLPLAVFLGVFIGSGLYTSFDDRDSYLVVSVLVTLPCVILPLFFPGEVDRNLPIRERFVFKAIVWNLIFSFIGNYIYTHYFYTLLGAEYTFDTYRFNDVPWPCYIITLTYYCFYHTLSTIALRFVTNATKQYAPLVRNIIYIVVVLLLSYLTAFLETLSIAQFPYYSFPDRAAMYKVRFPSFLRDPHESAFGVDALTNSRPFFFLGAFAFGSWFPLRSLGWFDFLRLVLCHQLPDVSSTG